MLTRSCATPFADGGAWILGDKFEFGVYDGGEFARRNGVVVVAGNYRLDALGWIALDELTKEDSEGATGNYGLQQVRPTAQRFPPSECLTCGAWRHTRSAGTKPRR